MGMSSSQGRLLSITARLTSNEYESQQISNAKMRLATRSQEASSEYIAALNTQQILYTTFDAKGEGNSENLTPALLYQYADMKNQYALVNATGQVLLGSVDAHNFKQASNLEEFLQSYGLEKIWKSTTLQTNADKLESPEFEGYKNAWQEKLKQAKNAKYTVQYKGKTHSNLDSSTAWGYEKSEANDNYNLAMKEYDDICFKKAAGVTVTNEAMQKALDNLNNAKRTYTDCVTYDQWIMSKAAYKRSPEFTGDYILDANGNKQESQEYLNMQEYYKYVEEFNAEAEDFGTKLEDLYYYEDENKTQWYTNLWYRLNGESSVKSAQGEKGTNYDVLDPKLFDNKKWILDALSKGSISIEMASNKDETNEIPDLLNPTVMNLKGISWNTKIYSSCSEVVQKDDDQAIARAEAEYERKNKEISDKDQQYQNKIKLLDTQHTALQTEYESVKSAMSKNIDRSFKTFS